MGTYREQGQAGAQLVAQQWQGIQQPELQKQVAESCYSIWSLKAIEKVKRECFLLKLLPTCSTGGRSGAGHRRHSDVHPTVVVRDCACQLHESLSVKGGVFSHV